MNRLAVTEKILTAKIVNGLKWRDIDFKMDLAREADPKGDHVNIVMSGKFLLYK